MCVRETKERYGRDKNNLHRAELPLYKGDSSDDGRDGEIFRLSLKNKIRCWIVGIFENIA
jgi:hypothetical protein